MGQKDKKDQVTKYIKSDISEDILFENKQKSEFKMRLVWSITEQFYTQFLNLFFLNIGKSNFHSEPLVNLLANILIRI